MTELTPEDRGTYRAAAAYADIPIGWVRRVSLGRHDLALANVEGTIYAIDHACPHARGPLGDNRLIDHCLVVCPWHGARFDVRTGEVHTGPARKPATRYPVRVQHGTVFVATEQTPPSAPESARSNE